MELRTRAAGRAKTYNPATRTASAVIASASPVPRRDEAGPYMEILDPAGLILTGDPVPLLNSHKRGESVDVIGRADGIRIEAGLVIAEVRLSGAVDIAGIRQRVEDGDLAGISIGYSVQEWRTGRDERGRRTKTAIRWSLSEVSLVPIPADPNAGIRTMPEEVIEAVPDRTGTRAAIREIARSAGLDATWADSVIDRDVSVLEARAEAFDAMQRRQTPVAAVRAQIGTDHTDPAAILERRAEALACRMAGTAPSDAAREFVGDGLADHARALLATRGEPARGGAEAIITRAMHTVSDFPLLLNSAGNRVLVDSYQAASSPLLTLARRTTRTDFRAVERLSLGGVGTLKEVSEHGEIVSTTRAEAKESYPLKTFARTFSLSRKAIVNDDLGAFADWNRAAGAAAAATEADQLVALLLSNPVMGDGKALYHSGHKNLATTAAAVNRGSLDAARLAMRKQTQLDGTLINVSPTHILVSPEIESQVETALATVNPGVVSDVNPWSNKLQVLVEPRLSGTAWHLFDSKLPVFEVAYLASAPGPQITSRDGWEVLGREFRVVLDFGCGAVEWRSTYKNAGSADPDA